MHLKIIKASVATSIMSIAAVTAHAQHAGHQHQHQHQHPQQPAPAHHMQGHTPYAGFQNREIKALSSQQMDDLRAGRGMSLALAAELNGFPGPMHVLELAAQLNLTPEQKVKVQELFSGMQKQAKALGEELITAERELDSLFKSRQIASASLDSQTQKIAQLQGKLRAVHLGKHLEMVQILTPEQVGSYNRFRGY